MSEAGEARRARDSRVLRLDCWARSTNGMACMIACNIASTMSCSGSASPRSLRRLGALAAPPKLRAPIQGHLQLSPHFSTLHF
jgi:hypothetical protein